MTPDGVLAGPKQRAIRRGHCPRGRRCHWGGSMSAHCIYHGACRRWRSVGGRPVFDVFVGEQVGAGKKSLAVNVSCVRRTGRSTPRRSWACARRSSRAPRRPTARCCVGDRHHLLGMLWLTLVSLFVLAEAVNCLAHLWKLPVGWSWISFHSVGSMTTPVGRADQKALHPRSGPLRARDRAPSESRSPDRVPTRVPCPEPRTIALWPAWFAAASPHLVCLRWQGSSGSMKTRTAVAVDVPALPTWNFSSVPCALSGRMSAHIRGDAAFFSTQFALQFDLPERVPASR